MKTFTIIPAIDLRHGNVVRLLKGDYARQTDYAVTPIELAHRYAQAGAEWLHVVDLDGARAGEQGNLPTLATLVGAGLKVQAGGGIRSEADLERLFDAGVERAVVGSLAVREPERVRGWIERYGAERITLALDARRREGAWQLATAGWVRSESATLEDMAKFYAGAGARHMLCTDIDRDGARSGPNVDLYGYLAQAFPTLAVQASGGVRNADDVQAVRERGVAGVILGRSLLEGTLSMADALQAGEAAPC